MSKNFELRELENKKINKMEKKEEIELLNFILEQSNASIEGQRENLNSLRQRAVNIIGINGAILLLVRIIISKNDDRDGEVSIESEFLYNESVYPVIAMLVFFLSILFCLYILKSRRDLRFGISGSRLMERYIFSDKYGSIQEIYRDYIYRSDMDYTSNQRVLDLLHAFLFAAICGTVGHGLIWIMEAYYG